MKVRFLTKNPKQTKKIGKILAKEILKIHFEKQAFILGLEGDLGGGKTTFLQGFAKGLGIKQKVISPTFVIMKKFDIPHYTFNNLYHLDCYRIEKPKELLSLGFKDIISYPTNIVAIEWVDKIKTLLPKNRLIIKFLFINDTTREIVLEYNNDWGQKKTPYY